MGTPLKVGSDEHRDLLCRFFIESHRQFEPDTIQWPELEGDDLRRPARAPRRLSIECG
jgi:hypothetical protein